MAHVPETMLLGVFFFLAAVMYSSVGHAGASAYLAVMALFGTAQSEMKPTALTLNVLVASIATVRFARVGYFSWRLFWPFALGSVPFAFVGGAITLDTRVYQYVVGVALAYAAVRMWREAADARASAVVSDPPVPVAVACGATIGFLSGATGVGGGVFLSPVVLLARWASPKATAAVSSAFILANSVSGLAGNLTSLASLPNGIGVWLACAGVGGAIGSGLGSTRFASSTVRRMLGVVLALAAAKMLLG